MNRLHTFNEHAILENMTSNYGVKVSLIDKDATDEIDPLRKITIVDDKLVIDNGGYNYEFPMDNVKNISFYKV